MRTGWPPPGRGRRHGGRQAVLPLAIRARRSAPLFPGIVDL
jgi:hypothetical protein